MLMTAPWPLRSSLRLDARPEAVPSARRHAKTILYEWRLGHVSATAELLVAELVTNAIHASTAVADVESVNPSVSLQLFAEDQYVRIEVWDTNTCSPVRADVDLLAETGRGLQLVDALSFRWSWYFPETGGKVVWAECAT
jgi:anti-sigma regulatory factor (Ser/Thr protein kinase)